MQTPLPRTALSRLVDERRVLHTCARLIVSDVAEARVEGASDRELALALGVDPARPAVELERREPAIAARCQHCEAPLFGRGELEHTRRPGERVVRCPSCERPNLFYSAAWLSTDEGGTP
jgi:hypothetical protein